MAVASVNHAFLTTIKIIDYRIPTIIRKQILNLLTQQTSPGLLWHAPLALPPAKIDVFLIV
jgi:hypothetical protein